MQVDLVVVLLQELSSFYGSRYFCRLNLFRMTSLLFKATVKALLSPWGAYLISDLAEGGAI